MLTRTLYWLSMVIALCVGALVVVAPWMGDSRTLVRLFAEDVVTRRTAVAVAFGLFVTARVFFRVPREEVDQRPRPTDAVGA